MAIYGCDGIPGSGKTYFAVKRAREQMRKGMPVYSNMPLYDMRVNKLGEPLDAETYGFPWGIFLANIEDLLSARRGLALIDEGDIWFNAMDYNKIPASARGYWTQSRHRGMNLLWTATHIDRMWNVIRDITGWVYRCVCFEGIPYLKNYTFNRMFDPQVTRTTRNSKMWHGTMYNPQIFKLYPTAYIQGDGKATTTGGLMGELEQNAIAPKVGSHEEWLHLAASSKRRLFYGEEVAPLLRPDEVRQLLIKLEVMRQAGPKGLLPDERIALRRLTKVARYLAGSKAKKGHR